MISRQSEPVVEQIVNTPLAIKVCHFVFTITVAFCEQLLGFVYQWKQEWILYSLLT